MFIETIYKLLPMLGTLGQRRALPTVTYNCVDACSSASTK